MTQSASRLPSLRERYARAGGTEELLACRDAFRRCMVSRRQSLVDLTVTAANAALTMPQELADADPMVLAALHETNPNLNFADWRDYSVDEAMGIVNAAKGKYFEHLVAARLNAGEAVGQLQLPEGYEAQIAESLTQPGWDLQIVDAGGHVSDYLQLKATDSLGYIHDTLERYPDITILGTSEVADRASGLVLDSGITEDAVRDQVLDTLHIADPGVVDSIVDAFNPLLPLVFVVASEGYRVVIGRASVEESLRSVRFRAERSLTASGIGALVYAIGGGWLGVPATFAGGWLYDWYRSQTLLVESLAKRTVRMRSFRLYQQERLIAGS